MIRGVLVILGIVAVLVMIAPPPTLAQQSRLPWSGSPRSAELTGDIVSALEVPII